MKLREAKKLCNKWEYRLGLKWWDITFVFITDKTEAYKTFGYDPDTIVMARSYPDWRYGTCTIYFNFPAMKSKEKWEGEKIIIHELCHVLVNEMREGHIDHEERVVTTLTKAFLWTEADCLK
jgi:hypothetical protein